MDGRRINHTERNTNPLFILFLSLVAAVIILLIVTVVMGAMLGKANKNLNTVEVKVRELEETVEQLEVALEAERNKIDLETEPSAEPENDGAASAPQNETEPIPAEAEEPVQQPAQEPVQQPAQEPEKQPETQPSASWLDLSGHSELAVKPSTLLSGYQKYYTTEGVNVRSGPGTGYKVITKVNRGETVQVAARESGWSFVKYGSKFGWIRSDYLSKTAPAPKTSSTTTRTEATSGSLKKS